MVNDPQGQALRGAGDGPTPRRSRATLRTLDDVAAEHARLYRRAERGDIATADASRLAYMLTCLGKAIEAAAQANGQTVNGTVVELLPPTLADFYESVRTVQAERLSINQEETQ